MDTTKTQNQTNAPKWRPITLMASVRYRAITFETTNFSANLGIFQPGEQLTPHVARFDDGGRHCIVAGLGGICASVIWHR